MLLRSAVRRKCGLVPHPLQRILVAWTECLATLLCIVYFFIDTCMGCVYDKVERTDWHRSPLHCIMVAWTILVQSRGRRWSRSSVWSMGLAVGDKAPASLLSKAGIQGKKAVVFFYGAECVCRHRSREASFVATPPHPHVCLPCSSC